MATEKDESKKAKPAAKPAESSGRSRGRKPAKAGQGRQGVKSKATEGGRR